MAWVCRCTLLYDKESIKLIFAFGPGNIYTTFELVMVQACTSTEKASDDALGYECALAKLTICNATQVMYVHVLTGPMKASWNSCLFERTCESHLLDFGL